MGIIPLCLKAGEDADTLGLTGHERYTIDLPSKASDIKPGQDVTFTTDNGKSFTCTVRFDTQVELQYFDHGGILPYVIRNLPDTPAPREDIWAHTTRQDSSNSGPFGICASPPAKHSAIPVEDRRRMGRPVFGGGNGGGGGGPNNPSITLRNLVLSPMKRPQLSRNRPQLFTL